MKSLFSEYLLLTKQLEQKGGRVAVVENLDLGQLYTDLLKIEDTVLQKFGLPKLMKFRAIIFNLKSETDFELVELELKNAAEHFLASSPKNETVLLENAKINNLKTYDILPAIGIDDTLFAMFCFEEYYKKGKINSKDLMHILRSIDEVTSTRLGDLHYYSIRRSMAEADKIWKELSENQIPYLMEFRDYRPVYPY